jgi:bacterial/archaeal transporter family-2 protein
LPLQALINAALGRQTFGPVFAALVSFGVGTVVLLLWWSLARPGFSLATLAKVPWWAWTGGIIGAIYVASATLLIPRMGAAPLICLVVLGQLIGSLVLDHYGVLHARQPIDATRVFGTLLVVAGVLLVVRPWQAPAA